MINIAAYFKPSSTFYILAFFLMLSSSQATDKFIENDTPSSRAKPNLTITIKPRDNMSKDLEDIKTYTGNLLKEGVLPKSILLVLDVDGVITNYSNPKDALSPESIGARGESVSFIINMITLGVNIVLSSGWPCFEETLQRLRNIGLEERLQISNADSYTKNDNHMLFEDICTKFCCFGLVASVSYSDMSTMCFGKSYYHQKAFAYKLVYPELEEDRITHVIFGDDSDQAVWDFEKDFNILKNKKDLFKTANIKLFTLSRARGEPYLK